MQYKIANRFDEFRRKMFGIDSAPRITKEIPLDLEGYSVAIKQVSQQLHNSEKGETVEKGLRGEEVAYSEPILGNISINPDFKEKRGAIGAHNLHAVLKRYGSNIILNAIINTRANQVSMFARPSRFSEKGQGFVVRLKDINDKPTPSQEKKIRQIEQFILNTGDNVDETRDSFVTFCKKLTRDTYMYDQVNFEKVYNSPKGELKYFKLVDPSTVFIATDKDGKVPKTGERYVQVIDDKIVARFTPQEMAFAVRNPRTDIYAGGYGYSELEIALKHFNAHENTERFNDRFFSHGGTVRGILKIKNGEGQSQTAMDMFKREWKSSLRGINGSWQIPVVNAEDVQFVNMTPSANDIQFEKWLNYLINVITSLYGIDPAEINFPNNGGATGSGGGSLNEGNSAQKTQASQNKGLLPLLMFIEDTINKHIMPAFGDEYLFQFVGGDIATQLEKIRILSEEAKIGRTTNEVREALGLEGDVLGGDVPLNGVIVQRIGQLLQQEQFEYQKRQDKLQLVLENTRGTQVKSEQLISFQDKQQGLAGNSGKVNGKDTFGRVGKDGQSKDLPNANAHKQSMNPDKD